MGLGGGATPSKTLHIIINIFYMAACFKSADETCRYLSIVARLECPKRVFITLRSTLFFLRFSVYNGQLSAEGSQDQEKVQYCVHV